MSNSGGIVPAHHRILLTPAGVSPCFPPVRRSRQPTVTMTVKLRPHPVPDAEASEYAPDTVLIAAPRQLSAEVFPCGPPDEYSQRHGVYASGG